jgi:hypothetical protein
MAAILIVLAAGFAGFFGSMWLDSHPGALWAPFLDVWDSLIPITIVALFVAVILGAAMLLVPGWGR